MTIVTTDNINVPNSNTTLVKVKLATGGNLGGFPQTIQIQHLLKLNYLSTSKKNI